MTKQLSDDDLLDDLRRTAEQVNGTLTCNEYRDLGSHAPKTVIDRFGTWNDAKEAAGLEITDRRHSGRANVECPACGYAWHYSADGSKVSCHECGSHHDISRARAYRLRKSNLIQQLARDGPQPLSDLDGTRTQYRERIAVLSAPSGGPGATKNRPKGTPVAYLVGDEREAMRVFIRENTAFVESCIADNYNSLAARWPDWQYELCWEMWAWLGYADE